MENSPIFKPLLTTTHAPINAHFSKNASDFVVREIPLYEFSGNGEHLVMQIQKKGLSTSEALSILASATGAKVRDFGYAGLKDKEGMTTQYISIPAKFQSAISSFSNENIKILNATRHNNKLRIGHLKANHFFIRLKKVCGEEYEMLIVVPPKNIKRVLNQAKKCRVKLNLLGKIINERAKFHGKFTHF